MTVLWTGRKFLWAWEGCWRCCVCGRHTFPEGAFSVSSPLQRVFEGWLGGCSQVEEVPRLAAALSNLSIFTRLTDDFLRKVRPPAARLFASVVAEAGDASLLAACGAQGGVHALQMASSMVERDVPSGEQLIRQGETGDATDEMYVVRSGQFEVFQERHGSMMLVNKKDAGDVFGELGLLYSTPRSATVKATMCVTGSPVPPFPCRRLPHQPAGIESVVFFQ